MDPLVERGRILRERSEDNVISMISGVAGLCCYAVLARLIARDRAGIVETVGMVLFGIGGALDVKGKGQSMAWGFCRLCRCSCWFFSRIGRNNG